jgi:hypothetical protein
VTDHTLQPEKASAWCQAKHLPAIPIATQRELVRIAAAVYQAIIDDDDSPPPEVRVYYQCRKFIARVSGAPEDGKHSRNEVVE